MNPNAIILDLKVFIKKLILIYDKRLDNTDSLYKYEEIKGILKILEFIQNFIEYRELFYETELDHSSDSVKDGLNL